MRSLLKSRDTLLPLTSKAIAASIRAISQQTGTAGRWGSPEARVRQDPRSDQRRVRDGNLAHREETTGTLYFLLPLRPPREEHSPRHQRSTPQRRNSSGVNG